MSEEQKEKELQERVDTKFIKCLSCGANMEFEPERQALYCSHCGSERKFNTDTLASEQDLLIGLNSESWQDAEENQYICENCSAKVIVSVNQSSFTCPFCGTNHVQKTNEFVGLKPNALLPFTFNKEKALEYSKAWAKKKFFAPNKFKKKLKTDNVQGVYVPCFTFDSYTYSEYAGRIGTTHVRYVGSGKNRRAVHYTVWRNISGVHYDNFDDVLLSAGSKCDQTQIEKLSPFETNFSKEYNPNYMLGFMAYKYDYEVESLWNVAKSKIDVAIKNTILSGYVYDKVAYFNVSTKHEKTTYKYVMLPVYVGNFVYVKKSYNFYVNGNTGKVWGKTPKSFWKIFFTIAIPVAIVIGCWFWLSLFG